MDYKQRRNARMIFKQLKAGIRKAEDLSSDEIKLLKKYYPFIFK